MVEIGASLVPLTVLPRDESTMRKPDFVSCPTRECLFGLVGGNSNNGGVKCQQKNSYRHLSY